MWAIGNCSRGPAAVPAARVRYPGSVAERRRFPRVLTEGSKPGGSRIVVCHGASMPRMSRDIRAVSGPRRTDDMRLDRHSPLPWLASLAIATMAGLGAGPSPASARSLGVEVWTDRGDDAVYQPGDAMTVKVRSTDDAYLLVYEIDSDGDVRLLYPWRRSNGLVDARHTVRLPDESSGYELVVEKQTGEGFVVAIASKEPFRDLPS